jgi:hypothetical protein
MKDGHILQRDIHVKAMNKLLPKFTFEHSRMYNMGETVVSCKIKVKRVRKYFYNYLFTPPDEIKAIYELDVIISDLYLMMSQVVLVTPSYSLIITRHPLIRG